MRKRSHGENQPAAALYIVEEPLVFLTEGR